MIIQINTDRNIPARAELTTALTDQIAGELDRFSDRISRIEAHLSDEDGNKDGENDIRCMLEARINGRPPVAVTNRAKTHEEAVSGAIEKLKNSLETIVGKLNQHHGN